jgi:hypothetical protein
MAGPPHAASHGGIYRLSMRRRRVPDRLLNGLKCVARAAKPS